MFRVILYKVKRRIIKYIHGLSEKIKLKILDKLVPSGFYMKLKGYCPTCEQNVTFISFNSWIRNNLVCPICLSLPRERALMVTVDKYYPNWKELVIFEASGSNRGISLKLKKECKNYIVSNYLPFKPMGSIIDGVRNEDIENLSFPDDSFDLVITQDVVEHVYNPPRAFQEIARVLKPGGAHIFTVPIVNKHKKTEIWARKGIDGNPIFLNNSDYHGPFPVTVHWGFDIIHFIKENTGQETIIEYIDDLDLGIRGEYGEIFVCKKFYNYKLIGH